jgi:hypothetical protein
MKTPLRPLTSLNLIGVDRQARRWVDMGGRRPIATAGIGTNAKLGRFSWAELK